MSVFFIAEIKVTDASWIPDYAAEVHKLVARHGGRYLSRSGNITSIEGAEKDASLIALIQFPGEARLRAFLSDPAYQPYIASRQAGSVSQFTMLDDTDIAGTIPYLTKG